MEETHLSISMVVQLIQEEKLRHWKVAELTLTVSNISG